MKLQMFKKIREKQYKRMKEQSKKAAKEEVSKARKRSKRKPLVGPSLHLEGTFIKKHNCLHDCNI